MGMEVFETFYGKKLLKVILESQEQCKGSMDHKEIVGGISKNNILLTSKIYLVK